MERKEFMEKVFLVLDYEMEKLIKELEKEVEKDAN